MFLLAACQHDATARLVEAGRASPMAPGVSPVGEAVDGLIVGHRLMAAGEYELALDAYTRAAATHGLTADVLSALGSANLRLGRLDQAETLLRRAVERDPEFVPAWNNLGVVLMEKAEAAEAVRAFQTAFALDRGRSEEIRNNLKRALAKRDETDYDAANNNSFELVRRGNGRFVLLATPASGVEQ